MSRSEKGRQTTGHKSTKSTGKAQKLLVINPGSTSTKIAVFVGRRAKFQTNIEHRRKELQACGDIISQGPYRRRVIEAELKRRGYEQVVFDAYVGRGGLLRPMSGGCWRVTETMLDDLRSCRFGRHACNLGAILADELARQVDRPAYIVDPVVIDELDEVARLSGHPDLPRRTTFHALSQKAVARKVAARIGRRYQQCNLIIAHIGGGVTVGAHRRGCVVEVNNALDGEGPFSPERTGALPLIPLLKLVRQRGWSVEQADEWSIRRGGLTAYLGTNDCRRIEQRMAGGDKDAARAYNAMAYQIALAIGACAVALSGRVHAIGLTGGASRSRYLVGRIRRRVGWIAPVYVYQKMEEMQALADGVLEVLERRSAAKTY